MPYQKFTCFIIGEGTLPIQCAEILWQRGHEIYGIVSPDILLQNWAEEQALPYVDPTRTLNLMAFFNRQPFDYLFSIVNYVLLPEIMESLPWWTINPSTSQVDPSLYKKILALPRRAAINYHDAPLPKYAGFYATSWAIMQQEKTHGVTWHKMTGQIDAGDILKQNLIDLAPFETALTLNARCYDVAVASFSELVDDLAYDRVPVKAQDMPERTYFPLFQRPLAGCVLSWQQSAEDIDAFVRALEFGPYPNPLGLPKLAIGQDFVIVSRLDVLDSSSEALPGTITGITDTSLTIATLTHQIALRQLLTIEGQPLPVSEAVARFKLYEGYKFEDLTQAQADRLTASNALICRHEAFWVNKLAGYQPITLPYRISTARQRAVAPEEPARVLSLPMPIPVEVGNFLATQYPTGCWSDFLLAAFVIYLARSSGINCFDVGFRPLELRRDLIDLAGFFASYVPLHIDLNPHWSFEQVYEAIQAQVELVKQRSTYARDVGARYPEFEAAYELPGQHSWPVAVEQVEDLADYEAGFGCELMLVIPKDEANSACRWVYDPNLFDEHSIKRMCRQFTTLLQGIITANVEQPLMALTLLTEVEQHQVLVEWNDTGVDFPPDQGLHQLFEAQVERTPEAVAVVFEGEQLTYQALNRRANQLAHYLQRSGVGPETPVGICMERSLEMVIALFGVLKAGGAYVPLDPAYPQERLAFMVTDAQSPVLLAQRALANRLSGFEGQVICLDTEGDPIAGERDENPTCGATSDNAAYVIYTSGSTGKPKGVVISHRAICNHMHWLQMTFPLTETDTVLQKTPFSFDASVWEFYAPLLAGGRLVMARPGGHQDGSYLVKTIVEQQVTILQLVPSLLKLLLQEPAFETCDSLKRVFCGGEVLRVELVERFFDYLTTELINLYGPTEATIDATFWTCERQHSQQNVPIGRPIANMQAYILDSHLNPVPVGIPGELCLAGTGLARGYLNRPGLTAEKFVPNPFSRKPGERLYKTGDQARYLPDGSIEFLGRLDHQVKVRGYRIELGEIETTLRGHPVVRETVVLARQDVSGNRGEDKQLVAYLVPRRQPVPSVSELRHYLAEKLPDYMIPATFITLDALPLTPNGKVDRRALPVPGRTRPRLAGTLVAPRNPAEEALADIWADVLGLESVGIHDNFFELGGHSLLATRVASRIRDAFQVKILLAGLFEAPTIAALALLVEEMLIAEIEGLADDEVQHLL